MELPAGMALRLMERRRESTRATRHSLSQEAGSSPSRSKRSDVGAPKRSVFSVMLLRRHANGHRSSASSAPGVPSHFLALGTVGSLSHCRKGMPLAFCKPGASGEERTSQEIRAGKRISTIFFAMLRLLLQRGAWNGEWEEEYVGAR